LKNKWIYALAVIFGLLTTYFLYGFLVSVEKKTIEGSREEIVVAACDIAPQTLLTREMLTIKKVPMDYIHPQALQKMEEAVGCISLTSVVNGEQVLKSKLATPGEVKNGLAYLVPVGKRAISIAVDEVSGVAGLLKPGDHVDVAAIMSFPDGIGGEELSSLIVLQNIPILAVGKKMSDKNSKMETDSNAKKTITLAVTIQEAQSLLLAGQKGSLRLLLRSPVDDSIAWTVPFKAQDFVE
jgi:pilus assembly protein CpaB